MPKLTGCRSGLAYDTGALLGKGGEGAVFAVNDQDVAKIYHINDRTSEKSRKLEHMVSLNVSHTRAAWPKEVLNENGAFVGFIMPRVENCKEINEVYQAGQQIGNLAFRIAVAHYLCDAVEEIHRAGQVCGDLNPKNVLARRNGTVILVDTDSFHIQNPANENRPFRCDKALADYVAPELQPKMKNGQTLNAAPLPTFTKETDRFAVAIHIFALLMNGCHPFANRLADLVLTEKRYSVVAPQPNENIENGFSPFFGKNPDLAPPAYAPPFSSLPQAIQDLFRKAFVDGHNKPSERPSCARWGMALKKWLDEELARMGTAAIPTPPPDMRQHEVQPTSPQPMQSQPMQPQPMQPQMMQPQPGYDPYVPMGQQEASIIQAPSEPGPIVVMPAGRHSAFKAGVTLISMGAALCLMTLILAHSIYVVLTIGTAIGAVVLMVGIVLAVGYKNR